MKASVSAATRQFIPGIFMLLLLAFGCGKVQESIDFLEPQPNTSENENSFNKRYRGHYRNLADSTQLLILQDRIIESRSIPVAFSRNDLDSTFTVDKTNDEQIKLVLAKENITVDRFAGDTIYSILATRDTIFKISDQNVCRFFKGSYFLNYTDDQATWKVHRLTLNKKELSLSRIMPTDSLFELLPVREKVIIRDDSGRVAHYQIKPSKKELKKLVKHNVFVESDKWIKVD